MLGDLFATEAPAAEAAPAAPAEEAAVAEPAPAMTEATPAEDTTADFTSAGTVAAAESTKKKGAAEEKLDAKEMKKLAKETAQQEEVRRQAAEVEALKASDAGFAALSKGDYAVAETNLITALAQLPDRPQNAAVHDQIVKGLAEAQYLRAQGLVKTRRDGKRVYYSLASPAASAVLMTLYQIYCHGGDGPPGK